MSKHLTVGTKNSLLTGEDLLKYQAQGAEVICCNWLEVRRKLTEIHSPTVYL